MQSLVVSSVSHQSCRFRILGWAGAHGLELAEVKGLLVCFCMSGTKCGIDETEDWYLGYVMFVDGVCCSFLSRGLVLVFRGYMCVWFGLDRNYDLPLIVTRQGCSR